MESNQRVILIHLSETPAKVSFGNCDLGTFPGWIVEQLEPSLLLSHKSNLLSNYLTESANCELTEELFFRLLKD